MEALGPVLILLSVPLILRWIPRNRIYGFRIASTLANDSVWYDANALSGRHMLTLGLVMVALEFVLPISIRTVVLRTVGIAGLGVIVVADWRTANRWRRERELTGQK
jgi:SdpI/YhfL family protein